MDTIGIGRNSLWRPHCPPLAHREPEMRSLEGPFFLFVSKGFSEAVRLSETGLRAEIGL